MTAAANRNPDTQLLTIPQVAERLSISDVQVYRLIRNGQIKVVDISSQGSSMTKARVVEADLINFIAAARQKAAHTTGGTA